jgi:hypothetical protein
MKTILSLFAAATLLLGANLAQAADPIVGTWTLNLSKSKFASAAPASETRTYSQSADGTISLTAKTVGADGREKSETSSFRLDGKEYPYKSDTIDADSVSERRISSHVTTWRLKKDGKVVETGRRTVSRDGRTLTMILRGTNVRGKKSTDVEVFDKE